MIKKYKPTSHGRRGMTQVIREIDQTKPEKVLLIAKTRLSGRAGGKVSVRHKGAGHKQFMRFVDLKQTKLNVPGKVISIEYDPGRSAYVAKIYWADGDKSYVIAPQGLEKGASIMQAEKAAIKVGNRTRLTNIPDGTSIYNIELNPGRGGQIVRSAGSSARLLGKEGKFAIVEMPSKETRYINKECFASIGIVSNPEHENTVFGKAGRKRWLGIRPTVRGKVMSPRAHPHGGGEGVNAIGIAYPKTPWGKPALGYKTRKNKRTDKFIIKRRRK